MPACSAASAQASRICQRTRGRSTRHSPPRAWTPCEVVLRHRPLVLVAEEVGQHVVPRPALAARLAPQVVVARLAAHVDHAVDGGAAAEHAAARIGEAAAVEAGLGGGRRSTSRPGDCRSSRGSRWGCGSRSSRRGRRPRSAARATSGPRTGGWPAGSRQCRRRRSRSRSCRARRVMPPCPRSMERRSAARPRACVGHAAATGKARSLRRTGGAAASRRPSITSGAAVPGDLARPPAKPLRV